MMHDAHEYSNSRRKTATALTLALESALVSGETERHQTRVSVITQEHPDPRLPATAAQ